ncbi:hypothetical protein SAMN06296378_0165 [Salinibacterium xinjiangense]|uniref:Uncharacterized protein n=1 Tax=Salinibacterium xinjiangense TaxID=386302 RepID=A0A2C8Y8T1_9MICO|nr:hypothetical protein SAMN06296378_0165 [Salinibacterium xinjiangense]
MMGVVQAGAFQRDPAICGAAPASLAGSTFSPWR